MTGAKTLEKHLLTNQPSVLNIEKDDQISRVQFIQLQPHKANDHRRMRLQLFVFYDALRNGFDGYWLMGYEPLVARPGPCGVVRNCLLSLWLPCGVGVLSDASVK